LQNEHFRSLSSDYLNQGKVLQCTAVDRNNNSFVKDGKYISFSGFKFIHRARLNLLPVNSSPAKHHADPKLEQCRRCGYFQETLPHIICHCKTHLGSEITERHNSILERVAKTVKYTNKNAKALVIICSRKVQLLNTVAR
jgi:hypothetical protein